MKTVCNDLIRYDSLSHWCQCVAIFMPEKKARNLFALLWGGTPATDWNTQWIVSDHRQIYLR
jgi:hypothetical protein